MPFPGLLGEGKGNSYFFILTLRKYMYCTLVTQFLFRIKTQDILSQEQKEPVHLIGRSGSWS